MQVHIVTFQKGFYYVGKVKDLKDFLSGVCRDFETVQKFVTAKLH